MEINLASFGFGIFAVAVIALLTIGVIGFVKSINLEKKFKKETLDIFSMIETLRSDVNVEITDLEIHIGEVHDSMVKLDHRIDSSYCIEKENPADHNA